MSTIINAKPELVNELYSNLTEKFNSNTLSLKVYNPNLNTIYVADKLSELEPVDEELVKQLLTKEITKEIYKNFNNYCKVHKLIYEFQDVSYSQVEDLLKSLLVRILHNVPVSVPIGKAIYEADSFVELLTNYKQEMVNQILWIED